MTSPDPIATCNGCRRPVVNPTKFSCTPCWNALPADIQLELLKSIDGVDFERYKRAANRARNWWHAHAVGMT